MLFYCTYYDWCGVCEGTGQSCCSTSVISLSIINKNCESFLIDWYIETYCNDNNPCTIDACQVNFDAYTGNCTHTPVVCASPNACQTQTCDDENLGTCIYNDLSCDGIP